MTHQHFVIYSHNKYAYIHIYMFMQKYTYIYIYWIHTDAMIKTDAMTNDAGINHAHRKTQEDFFINYFTSHFICKVSKRVTQSLRVRGGWRPNITEIFWPRSYGRQRCVFLVLHGCSSGALAFLTTSRPTPPPTILLVLNSTRLCPARRTQLSFVQFVGLILPSNSHALI